MTQRELAEYTAIPDALISQYEHGRKSPSPENMFRLEQQLAVAPGYFMDAPTPQSSAGRIAAARIARGWSQRQLADALAVTPGAVAQWETGRTKPSTARLAEIAKRLDVPMSRLTGIAAFAEGEAPAVSDPTESNPATELNGKAARAHTAPREGAPPSRGGSLAMDAGAGPVDWPGIVQALIASLQAQQEIERRRIEDVEAPTARASEIRAQNESATRKQLDRAMEMLAQQYAPGRGEAAAQERSS